MLLKLIELSNNLDTPKFWRATLTLNQAVLLVGRNATGKSKILAGVGNLARLITGRVKLADCGFRAEFLQDGAPVVYSLSIKNSVVVSESFSVGGELLLERGAAGDGWIRAVQAGVDRLQFRVPAAELAVLAKRDLVQHPFLEPLHEWARALRYYRFNELRRNQFALLKPEDHTAPDPTDYNQAVALFHAATLAHGAEFSRAIVADLNTLGYRVSDVTIEPMDAPNAAYGGTLTSGQSASRLYGLSLQEKDLKSRTRQPEMSDGLFRALSLLVHATYAQVASTPSCMLIDDIGEGLDYERSAALIKLLLAKAAHKAIQLVMSTNDRFVMNAVPLEAWCGLKRTADGVQTICELTHPDLFEDFKLTGLNNFDFFTMDFFEAQGDTDLKTSGTEDQERS